jgi:hypothetical protein
MTTFLLSGVYSQDCELNMSDQITIPADVWTMLDTGSLPMFAAIGDSSVVGRLRPAVVGDELANDSCLLPQWLWRMTDSNEPETWLSIRVCELPMAGTIVLRARHEATLVDMEDPVAVLSASLSGSNGPSWSCLSTGAELPLLCGTFDIMEIRDSEGNSVPAACILDCDVNLEIMTALDHVERPPTPVPAPIPLIQHPKTSATTRFVPFSGVGRRLCD